MSASSLPPPPVFEGENFDYWAVSMEAFLMAHGLWNVIEEGYDTTPPPDDPTVQQIKDQADLKQKNFKALTFIQSAESNLNSSAFESRFIEALFYYSAYFDCLDACMERDDQHRIALEYQLSKAIKNIVVAEGGDRTVRHVKIDVWRAFFFHFSMVEKDLSASSLYQADMMIKTFSSWSSCTLDMDGKCLIIGWKGTPIHSLSVWKFLDHSK